MLQWTSKQFDGNRSLFKYPYQENIKQQLRVINCYRIAIGEETIPIVPEHFENGDATLLKISDKRDDWERRNQLGFALISMSVTKPVLNKINAQTTNCREAYLILENTYGGNLTVNRENSLTVCLLEVQESLVQVVFFFELTILFLRNRGFYNQDKFSRPLYKDCACGIVEIFVLLE